MDASSWATIWVLLGLFAFFGVLFYFKVPPMLTVALDNRAKKISEELEEARRLREEAEAVLAEYKKKTGDVEAEAEAIIAQARREAEALSAEAKTRIEDYVERRTKAVESRIAQAETQAVADVRSRAIDVAAAAAGQILAERGKGSGGDELVARSIDQLRKNLN